MQSQNTRKKPSGCGSSCIVIRLHDSAHLVLKFNGSTYKLHFGSEFNPSISLSQYNISTHRMFRYVVMNLNTAHIQVCRKKSTHTKYMHRHLERERTKNSDLGGSQSKNKWWGISSWPCYRTIYINFIHKTAIIFLFFHYLYIQPWHLLCKYAATTHCDLAG